MATTTEHRFITKICIVKICGITNLEDAQTAIAAGANALGFNFYLKSPRYLSPARAHEIAAALPASVLKVGVFVNAPEAELRTFAAAVPLDVLQLHGEAAVIPVASPCRIWRAIPPNAEPAQDPRIEAYLIDTPTPAYGGSGQMFDWTLAANRPYRVIVAGGLDASNVAQAIRHINPWGVDSCSRLEDHPGKKNAQRVREFVRAARAESHATL